MHSFNGNLCEKAGYFSVVVLNHWQLDAPRRLRGSEHCHLQQVFESIAPDRYDVLS